MNEYYKNKMIKIASKWFDLDQSFIEAAFNKGEKENGEREPDHRRNMADK